MPSVSKKLVTAPIAMPRSVGAFASPALLRAIQRQAK
jgi:hypothetical protein